MRRALLAATLVLALVAAPAGADPAVNGVFNLPGVTTNGQLTAGPDGNIWIALEVAVGKVTPDGTATPLASADLNNTLGSPTGGIVSAGGFIWVSQAPNGGKKAIVKIPPGNPAAATGVDVTDIDAGATAMTTGPDGNVWVGLPNKIVRFTPTDPPSATTFNTPGLSPKGMTSASDGTLWVTDSTNGQLVNLTTGGTPTPYPTGGNPQFISGGPSGQVAFGDPGIQQRIGLLSPGGTPQFLNRPNGSDPFGVTFGNDGAYWIAEFAANRLARVTTDGQLTTLTGFPDAVPGTQGPRQITTGPNNTLWTTIDTPSDKTKSKVARITGVEPPPQPPPPDTTPPGDQTPITTPPPPPDTTAPVFTLVSLSKAHTIRFTLSEAAAVKLTLSRAAAGKRRGKACLRPTPRLRKARRCTRFVRMRTISANGIAGQNSIRFAAKKLRIGRYRVVLTAVDAAGNKATPVTRTFRVRR